MGLFDRALGGDQQALARLATRLENDDQLALDELDKRTGSAPQVRVIGITGPPGAGKSTLINGLLTELRKEGERIAVLLVDPSSQTTGGAVLGDRVRMLSWGDSDVFVRSQATRGQEGGLAASTVTLIELFGLAGFTTVVIETVGVGQDGIDIRQVCDTTIVVQSPHQGDGVQSLKAGILEIADIFVVTKADLPGSHQTVRDLNAMLHLAPESQTGWTIPVVPVSAVDSAGLSELSTAVIRHTRFVDEHQGPGAGSNRKRWEITKRAIGNVQRASRTFTVREEQSRAEAIAELLELARSGR